jgi:hypothetical protein
VTREDAGLLYYSDPRGDHYPFGEVRR